MAYKDAETRRAYDNRPEVKARKRLIHNAWARKRYHANLEKYRAKNRQSYARNKASRQKANRAYDKAHKEARQRRKDRYHAKHPTRVREQHKVHSATRRAHKQGAPKNDFTSAQWRLLQIAFDHRCAYCGKRAKGHLTQDHITPLSQGGSHTLHNIVPACRPCNGSKYTGPPPMQVQPLLF